MVALKDEDGVVAAGETSTVTIRLLLQVVADQRGLTGAERVIQHAGMQTQKAKLRGLTGRIPHTAKLLMFDAAAAETSNSRIGLLLGAAALKDRGLAPLRALARAHGSTAALLNSASRLSTRLDTASVIRTDEVTDGKAVLAWRALPPHRPHRVDCDYTFGLLHQAPVLFGLPPAQVSHDVCQLNGAPECRYDVTWKEKPFQRLRRLNGRKKRAPQELESAERRLYALQGAATDLTSGESLADVLERIASRANVAVHAPGHLLAVTLPDGTRHISCRGTGAILTEALGSGTELNLAHPSLVGMPVVTSPVTSADHSYGVLAAVAYPGQEFFPEDRETLGAYAHHAALGLDIARLFIETREQGETAQLLLDVARSLNQRSTVESIAQTVADAVPALSGADRSAVALWDDDAGEVRIGAMMGWEGALAEKLANYITTAAESPELAALLANNLPQLVNRNGSQWAQRTVEDFEVQAFAGTPITTDGKLVGIILAHWADKPAPHSLTEVMTERLAGLAGLAGVALDNAKLLEETRRQALHDPLTGLPNRAKLESRIEAALIRAAWTEGRVGLLFCDLNRFKRINDSLGHSAGDYVLQQVAARITSAIREGDMVSRYSGDEFIVLLESLHAETEAEVQAEMEGIAARIRLILSEPFEVNGKKLFLDAAIGTALSDALTDGTPENVSEAARRLVECADLAMYRSKARTRGQAPARTHSPYRLQLETDLRGAAARGELQVLFQPQVDLQTRKVVAAEALLRWRHPELGMIPPTEFIPLAEESNLMGEIGAYVLDEACRAGAAWHSLGYPIEVAVNISAAQLNTACFSALITQILRKSGFPATALILEITETQVISENADVSSLWDLKELGVGISIDDFGTGYSSMTQLHRLPVSEIKIDKSFISTLGPNGSDAFVAGIVGLACGLGLRVIAEGVENAQQLAALQSLGCERAQGYFLGQPGDASSLQRLLTSGT
ncbi:putative bifunctional diguanylate cyclase/phosphodiesterase [Arthrobacter tumbae]|uniref:putative bifunctional diguanylate cyclase/phosphodiesterase n=1 Tax=Arthrobacter tumbae TaxID=163874 RepID=UPI0019564BA1|nr:bifunctional diguanylate cyclase/phosphodiesterase [Arthrobacter tumbae]